MGIREKGIQPQVFNRYIFNFKIFLRLKGVSE